MSFLLDTCVLSEFTRRQPDQRVVDWLTSVDEENLFISVITIGEIQHGIERLPDSHRKTTLLTWMSTGLIERFTGRVVAIDMPVMLLWGSLVARLEASGQPVGVMDSLLAASALHNHLFVATRNVADFLPCGVQVLNPWK